ALGHQGTEPADLLRHLGAFRCQTPNEGQLAAFAPEFAGLTAEIQHRYLALGIELAEVAPFALAATAGLRLGGMEGRVAQGDIEAFIGRNHAGEDPLRVALLTQADRLVQLVRRDDGACRGQCDGIDIRAGEMPAVLALADQRVDAVGAGADVQRLDRRATRYHSVVLRGQQVGQAVQVVGAPGNRRAQVTRRNVPVSDAVELLEQGAVEYADGVRVGEVDALLAVGVAYDEGGEFRARGDKREKVVAPAVPVARMQ